MKNDPTPQRWLLALESSTANGGAALLCEGEAVETVRLAEGLRHGRELLPSAAGLLERRGLRAGDLWGVAVSHGPGSYTGTRVGVMSAKALAFGADLRLAAVSSLAALAATLLVEKRAADGDTVLVLQDARRDEVYAGLYRLDGGDAVPLAHDAAIAPEEAAGRLASLAGQGLTPVLAGSAFVTYADLFRGLGGGDAAPGLVNPAAVGLLGWRHLLRDKSADPMTLQPHYLRRDEGADWRKDSLITRS